MIINTSRSFQGGDLSASPYGQVVKSGLRMVSFKEKEKQFLFILPPYKQDSEGNGVWYKPVKIRDNFGLDVKEKFAVGPNCPIDYFASKVKMYFPSYAQIGEKQPEGGGQKRKVYPSYGRVTTRVLFNTAYVNDLGQGAHILDVPLSGCAEHVEKACRDRDADGNLMPLLNDWQASIPIAFTFKKNNPGGNPWSVTIDYSKKYTLPQALADSENLYNLDEVVCYQNNDELIEKLRRITPNEIFEKCIAGYSDGSVSVRMSSPSVPVSTVKKAAPVEDDIPMSYPPVQPQSVPTVTAAQATSPVFSIPKASIPSSQPQTAKAAPENFDVDVARKWLSENKK